MIERWEKVVQLNEIRMWKLLREVEGEQNLVWLLSYGWHLSMSRWGYFLFAL